MLFSFIPMLLALSPPAATPQEGRASVEWPTRAWPVSTPAAEGIDEGVLTAIDAEVRAGKHGLVDGLLLIRHGKVVFERSYEQDYVKANDGLDDTPHQFNYNHPDWHPFYRREDTKDEDLHTLQSVTKSVASTMIGVAIHQGVIAGTDAPALGFFEEREFPDPDGRKAAMTLEDVLTMRSGFEWDEWSFGFDDPRNDCIMLEGQDDWVAFVLAKPMATDPGTTFVYNSGSSHLLSAIIQHTTGDTIDVYAEKQLFGPLGIETYHWKKTPRGLPDTEGGLYLLPRDLAKIGFLFLHDGVWDGERLLPEGWVARATTPWVKDISPQNGRKDPGYGYKWWIMDAAEDGTARIYAARGYGGQVLLVVPEKELIAVFTAWNIYGGYGEMSGTFFRRILPATE